MTSEEFYIVLRDYIRQMQTPSALSRLAQFGKQSKDAAANRISQQAMSAAIGSESDNARLEEVLRAVVAYIDTEVNILENEITSIVGDSIKLGVTTGFTLGGTPPEFDTVTETGKTWVTANTKVIPFTPVPVTSAYEFYAVKVDNYVAGDGFDVTLYNPQNTAAGAGPDVVWIGFPNGYNS